MAVRSDCSCSTCSYEVAPAGRGAPVRIILSKTDALNTGWKVGDKTKGPEMQGVERKIGRGRKV